jgi:myo-inositol-1(or 4)-monophosphatase
MRISSLSLNSFMSDFWTEVLDFATATADRVGTQLLQNFNQAAGQTQSEQKADGSLVTASDQWADAELRAAIAAAFPTHGIISEETQHIFPDTDWCWIIDPLDGTTNFTRGLPLWAISLGLLYKGTPVFGYVTVPPIGQSFYGYWVGDSGLEDMPIGAFRNGLPIAASREALTKNHFFNLCARSLGVLQSPVPAKLRMLGATTYSFLTVACGTSMGAVEATPKVWDVAAVWPIVLAAGGVWQALEPGEVWPLEVGKDYSSRSYPTLVVSGKPALAVFGPLVQTARPG